MNITAPVSHLIEIEQLIAAGADELYCGVVPSDWISQFNTGAVNRRYHGNFKSLAELEQAVVTAHNLGAKLFLVLNAQHYGEGQVDALVNIARDFYGMGGDAVIVADMLVMLSLRELVPDIAIHVSSVASCRNCAAVSLYKDIGARRVILPRDVSLSEIKVIAKSCPETEIEVFILNDGCVFEEGVCHSIHLPMKQGGPICVDNAEFEYLGTSAQPLSPKVMSRLSENEENYRRWLWYRFGCGFSTTDVGYPFGPCGLCAIHQLREAGVLAIKVAGREGATDRKIKSVEMVREVLDSARDGADELTLANTAVGIRNTVEHCQSGYMCYYPEVRWK